MLKPLKVVNHRLMVKNGIVEQPLDMDVVNKLLTGGNAGDININSYTAPPGSVGLIQLTKNLVRYILPPRVVMTYGFDRNQAIPHVTPTLIVGFQIRDLSRGLINAQSMRLTWATPQKDDSTNSVDMLQLDQPTRYTLRQLPYPNLFDFILDGDSMREMSNHDDIGTDCCWGSTSIPNGQNHIDQIDNLLSSYFHSAPNRDLRVHYFDFERLSNIEVGALLVDQTEADAAILSNDIKRIKFWRFVQQTSQCDDEELAELIQKLHEATEKSAGIVLLELQAAVLTHDNKAEMLIHGAEFWQLLAPFVRDLGSAEF